MNIIIIVMVVVGIAKVNVVYNIARPYVSHNIIAARHAPHGKDRYRSTSSLAI